MNKQEMIDNLTERYETLKQEILDMQNQFNIKREEFLKIQGALEALSVLTQDQVETTEDN
jgi:chaperonin cofactor prefoldin